MAIKTEIVTVRGREFYRTWSDAGRYVVRDGIAYTEAVDPLDSGRVYEEGEVIPAEDEAATEEDYKAALAEMGVMLGGE